MTEPKRQFTGFFIPVAVLNDTRLSGTDKLLLAEIDALRGERNEGCWASNAHLGKAVGISAERAKHIIVKLRKLGYVKTVKEDGRLRWLRATLTPSGDPPARSDSGGQPGRMQPTSQVGFDLKEPNIDSNQERTKGRPASGRAVLEAQAEKIYKAYPLKAKRPRAIAAIVKHLRAGVPYEVLLRKTEAFAMARAGNMDSCPHPATWFNGEGFNDDPATWRPSKPTTRGGGATSNLRLDGKTEADLQIMAADRYAKLDTFDRNYGPNAPGAVARQRAQLTAELAQLREAITKQKGNNKQ